MSLPTSPEGQPLIPDSRILKHGPKRLRPMQGVTLDNETGLWRPKYNKKSADPQDRKKLLERVAAEKNRPVPAEAKPFDLRSYLPLPGRCLLKVGREIEVEGVAIPDASKRRTDTFTVLAVSGAVEFRVGDTVVLEKNSHKRPLAVSDPAHILVKSRRIAAVLES